MDPDATLRDIECLLSNGNEQSEHDAEDLADDLKGWLASGGFEPEWWQFPAAAAFVRGELL